MIQKIILGFLIQMAILPACLAQQSNEAAVDYHLPDVMRTESGKIINTVADWERIRRPEITALFEENVQGKTPVKHIPLRFVSMSVSHHALNGTATRKQVRVYFSRDGKYYMDILLYLPNKRNKPAPMFVGLNFGGNQVVNADTGILISKRWVKYAPEPAYKDHLATAASRGIQSNDWCIEKIIAAGYGVATVYYGDLQPDSANSVNAGVAPLFYKKGQKEPAAD
ncbi:hypothetical protein, partial [Chitinophaga sp.]|uniref:hypothetical protein n=1 Tax=Chitinophaga sp. TaxID=1869181 RepID=UPI002C4B031F